MIKHIRSWIENCGTTLFEFVISSAIIILLVYVLYSLWTVHDSPKIELNKSEYTCTDFATVRQTRPQISGKIVIMIPYDVKTCTTYTRLIK